MTNASNDIRQLMDRLATLNESIEEPSPLQEGIFDGIKGMMDRRAGRKERQEMLSKLSKEWNFWLGKTDRDGTIEDMMVFLQQVVKMDKPDVAYVLDLDVADKEEAGDQKEDPADSEDTKSEEPAADDVEEPNEEDGIPLPDMDAKLSDYGAVGADAKEVHGDPATFKLANGEWDEDRIQKKLEKLGDGKILVLGDSHFTLEDEAEEEKVVQTESILNEYALNSLSKSELRDIFSSVVNFHLDNLPTGRDSERNANYDLSGSSQTSGSASRKKDPTGDNYDLDKMWQIMKKDGMSSQVVKRVMRKVADSSNVGDMTDQEMKHLSMIGYAFIKSGM